MPHTILYARVSSAGQTIQHQQTQAEQAGFKIDEVVADDGVSGVSTRLCERAEGRRLYDKLRAGDVLVVLDDADARVELAAAEAALRQAQQRFSQARANDRQLGARVAGASADITGARARLASAEADLARASDAVTRS